jgi:hypothetical protein
MTEAVEDRASRCLEFGAKWPYDASDQWNEATHTAADAPPAKDWAHAAARGIIDDLMDRRDIKLGFRDVDEETRAEIVATMAAIIRLAHSTTWQPAWPEITT